MIFDVGGECLVDETQEYGSWADWLGGPRHVFSAEFGAVIARGPGSCYSGQVPEDHASPPVAPIDGSARAPSRVSFACGRCPALPLKAASRTCRFMTDAQCLYRSRAFAERPPYEGTEIPTRIQQYWIFFERML